MKKTPSFDVIVPFKQLKEVWLSWYNYQYKGSILGTSVSVGYQTKKWAVEAVYKNRINWVIRFS